MNPLPDTNDAAVAAMAVALELMGLMEPAVKAQIREMKVEEAGQFVATTYRQILTALRTP